MSEALTIMQGSKAARYISLLPQIKAVIEGEPELVANLANIAACLKEQFQWLWVGFYLVKKNELVLGPFQGPLACTRIQKGKGVCGMAWERQETQIVPDVNTYPGHIACSSLSLSEIVIPVIRNGEVVAVLDADSANYAHFDETDRIYLEVLVKGIVFPDPE